MSKLRFYVLGLISWGMLSNTAWAEVSSDCDHVEKTCIEAGGTRFIDGTAVTLDCWKYQTVMQCRDSSGEDTDCDNLSACTVISSQAKNSQESEVTLDCTKTSTQRVCVDQQSQTVCDSGDYQKGMTPGARTENNNLSRAASYMSVMEGAQNELSQESSWVEIFAGKASHCVSPWGGDLVRDCCTLNVSNRGFAFNNCSSEEKQLAGSRRAGRTHFIGRRCSNWLDLGIAKVCLEHQETYCVYASLLTRLIQEQGRDQINQLALSQNETHNAVTDTLTELYTDTTAHWNTVTVNDVSVASWSWQAIHSESVPITLQLNKSLAVSNDSSARMRGVTITMHCSAELCDGSITSNGLSQTIQFDPTCQQVALQSWQVGNSVVEQSGCLIQNENNLNWPDLHWNNDAPSFFIFNVKSVAPEAFSSTALDWDLENGVQLQGSGYCDATTCSYALTLMDDGQSMSGQFTFPLTCQLDSAYATTLGPLTLSPVCAGEGSVFAVCTLGRNCGALPESPTLDHSGLNGWQLFQVNNSATWQALTATIFVQGGCTQNDCQWQIKSLGPSGVSDTVQSELSWNLYQSQTVDGNAQAGFATTAIETSFGVGVKPYLVEPGSEPQAIQLQYQVPGADWVTTTAPLSIPQASPQIINQSPEIALWGGCSLTTGVCQYEMTGQVTVSAMPWGDAEHPQCEGFTQNEMLLINWDQIDFSEYEQSLGTTLSASDLNTLQKTGIEAATSSGVATASLAIDEGTAVSSGAPNNQQAALKVTPLEGIGPFTVTALGVSDWATSDVTNKTSDPVNKVVLEWGDGAQSTITETTQVAGVSVFRAEHTYLEPPGHNVTENIQATFFTQSGSHSATASISNIYDTPDSGVSAEASGNHTETTSSALNQMPDHGDYDASQVPGVPK